MNKIITYLLLSFPLLVSGQTRSVMTDTSGRHVAPSNYAAPLALSMTNKYFGIGSAYNHFYDSFQGLPEMGAAQFTNRRSLSGHSYVILDSAGRGGETNFHLNAGGYLEHTNAGSNPSLSWYLFITNFNQIYGVVTNFTRFGCLYTIIGTNDYINEDGLTMASTPRQNLGAGYQTHIANTLQSISVTRASVETFISVSNPNLFLKYGDDVMHMMEFQCWSNTMQLRFDDRVYTAYSTNGLAWMQQQCIYFQMLGLNTNVVRYRLYAIWAGSAYPDFIAAQQGNTYTPTSGVSYFRYTRPVYGGGRYTNTHNDYYIGHFPSASIGVTQHLAPLGSYWGRPLIIADESGSSKGGVSNIVVLPNGSEKICCGVDGTLLSSFTLTNPYAMLQLMSSPIGWRIISVRTNNTAF